MWTRRDFAILAASAAATFGLTLASFLPRIATAGDAPSPTGVITLPTLHLAGCDVFAQMGKGDDVIRSEAANVTIKPGPVPKIELVVKNRSDAAMTASFDATLSIAPPRSPLARGMSFPTPVWTEPYSLVLKPGEAQTVELPIKANFVAGNVGNLSLRAAGDKNVMVALSLNSPMLLRVSQKSGAASDTVQIAGPSTGIPVVAGTPMDLRAVNVTQGPDRKFTLSALKASETHDAFTQNVAPAAPTPTNILTK